MMFIEKEILFKSPDLDISKQGRVQERKNPREEQEVDFRFRKLQRPEYNYLI